jgi:hypothetical protein
VIGWLTGKVALYVSVALLAVCVGLGIALWVQGIALSACRTDVDRKQVDIDRLEGEKKRLLTAVDDQNKAIAALKKLADEKGTAASEALAKARAATAKYEASRKRIAGLLAAPTPAGAGCPEAVKAVRRELTP